MEWVIHIRREAEQRNGTRRRTVGTYQVLHDGEPVEGLSGMVAESPGPGENDHPASREDPRRVLPGRYPLGTHIGPHYATIGYRDDPDHPVPLMPAIALLDTEPRFDILIHPGKNEFLSSIGCINPCTSLPDGSEKIDFPGSRGRVIALIDDMAAFLGGAFPTHNERAIPNAWAVIEGEPAAA